MAKMAFTLMLMGLPLSVLSQTKPASWDSLRTLRSGEKIEVVETSLKKHAGTFSTVSEDAIQLREGSNEVGIRKENVARVTLLDKSHRLRNALILGGAGAGAGAGIGAATSGNSFLGRGPATAVGAVIGAVGGTGIGAAIPSHPTIYRAEQAKSNASQH